MKDRRVVMPVGDGGVVADDVRRAGRLQPGRRAHRRGQAARGLCPCAGGLCLHGAVGVRAGAGERRRV